MYKAVFFDFDGVLTMNQAGSEPTLAYIGMLTGMDMQLLQDSFSPLERESKLGRMNLSELAQRFSEKIGFNIEEADLIKGFEAALPNMEMIRYAGDLRAKYATGIITDNIPERFELLRKKFGLGSYFNMFITSAEAKCMKDREEIFLVALDKANAVPTEAVFIDNTKANGTVPAQMGMAFVHYRFGDAANLSHKLAELGI